jgi:hypothetical protein
MRKCGGENMRTVEEVTVRLIAPGLTESSQS